MSFAQEYLDLVTECCSKLRSMSKDYGPTLSFFGVTAPFTDRKASEIVQCTVEEYESYVRLYYKKGYPEEAVEFIFSSHEDCLQNSHLLKDSLDIEDFILNCFQYELEDFKDDRTKLEEIFASFSERDLEYFTSCYVTSLEAYIIDTYRLKYQELKSQYQGLPYHPSFDFNYCLEDYYESSTC